MLRIGLLGASKIAVPAVIAPASKMAGVTVVAVAARDLQKAKTYADTHSIAAVCADYEALLARDDVDLVYNGLPPSAHAPWTIAALRAGKAVLCEKPFCMDAGQAAQMVAAASASGRALIEAYHYRFHPMFEHLMTLLADNAIGAVQNIDAHFNIGIQNPPGELRYVPTLGGGAMMDLGCYPLHWVRMVAGSEPTVHDAKARWHDSGVDDAMRASLTFADGVSASIACDMSASLPHEIDAALTITGSTGRIHIDNPIAPHKGYTFELTQGGHSQQVRLPDDNHTTYWYQLQHVLAVLHGERQPVTGGADAVNTMRAIDAIYAAARV
ncbi:MAG: Gfo/Idh/MocA family oxidoreductase [Pseudomonadota bacterium]